MARQLPAEFEFKTQNTWLRACIYLENTEGMTASIRIWIKNPQHLAKSLYLARVHRGQDR